MFFFPLNSESVKSIKNNYLNYKIVEISKTQILKGPQVCVGPYGFYIDYKFLFVKIHFN